MAPNQSKTQDGGGTANPATPAVGQGNQGASADDVVSRVAGLMQQAQGGEGPPAAASGANGQAEPASPRNPLSGKVEVEIEEGVIREVDAKELVEAYRKAGELDELQRSLDRAMQRHASAVHVAQTIEGMDEDVRTRVLQILADPSVLRSKSGDADDEIESLMTRGGGNGKGSDKVIAELSKRLDALYDYANHQIAREREQTTQQRVEAELNSFKALQEHDRLSPQQNEKVRAARELVREATLTAIAANPNIDVKKAMGSYIAKAHKMLAADPLPPSPDYRGRRGTNLEPPDKPPTADDLLSGGLLERLQQQFRL